MEDKLAAEYGSDNKGAIYGTMNKIGASRGSRETAKGRALQSKHDSDMANDHDADDAPKNVLKGLGKK